MVSSIFLMTYSTPRSLALASSRLRCRLGDVDVARPAITRCTVLLLTDQVIRLDVALAHVHLLPRLVTSSMDGTTDTPGTTGVRYYWGVLVSERQWLRMSSR